MPVDEHGIGQWPQMFGWLELEHRYRTAKEPNERTWWQILWLLAQVRTATELSAVIGYRAYWIGQIAKRYNEQGPRACATDAKPPSTGQRRSYPLNSKRNYAGSWPKPLPSISTGGHVRWLPG